MTAKRASLSQSRGCDTLQSRSVLNLLVVLIVGSMRSLQRRTTERLRAEAVVAHNEREVLLQRIESLGDEGWRLRHTMRKH